MHALHQNRISPTIPESPIHDHKTYNMRKKKEKNTHYLSLLYLHTLQGNPRLPSSTVGLLSSPSSAVGLLSPHSTSANLRECSSDIAFSYFCRPNKVWSMLHHELMGVSSE